MVHAEWFILNLRSQVRNLQSLLNYLESRELVEREEYFYSHEKLQHVVKELTELDDWIN